MPASARTSAINAIAKLNIITGTVNYTVKPLKVVYGEHVFNEEVRRQRLPRHGLQGPAKHHQGRRGT